MLTSLEIFNFGAIRELELDLSKPNILFSMSGAGKTTVADAARILQFGACSRTDAGGKGAAKLVRGGAECAKIIGGCSGADLHAVIHPANHKPATDWYALDVHGEQMDAYPDREALWRELAKGTGKTSAQLMRDARICADPIGYLASKDISAALADLNVQTINLNVQGTSEQVAWFRHWAGTKRLPIATAAQLKKAGEAAFSHRTDINRDLKLSKGNLAEMPATYLPDGVTAESAHGRLCSAQMDASESVHTLAALDAEKQAGDRVAAAGNPEDIRAEIELVNEQIAALDTQITALAVDIARAENTVHGYRGAKDSAFETQQKADYAIADIMATSKAMKALPVPLCATCKESLRAHFSPKLETAKAAKAEATVKYDAAMISLHEAGKDVLGLQARRAPILREIGTAQAKRGELTGRLKALDGLGAARTREAIDADVVEATAKRDAAQAVIREIEVWQSRQDAEKHIAALEDEVGLLTWACKMFKDGEAFTSAARGPIQEFADRANAGLVRFGLELSFGVDGAAITPMLSVRGATPRPVAECSGGEQTIAAWAIAREFAGGKLLIILDEINRADGEWRAMLLSELREYSGPAIVCSAWQHDEEHWKKNADVIRKAWAPANVVWMERDTTVRLRKP